MERTLMSFDYAMKDVLRNKANFGVLSGLLSELLKQDIVVEELLESESNPEGKEGKCNRLDVKAKINGGEIAIFEIQSSKESDFFHRMLFGTSKTIVEQLSEGDKYEEIKKVYSIDIVYFDLGEGTDYIYHGQTEFKGIHNKETLLLSDRERELLPLHKRELEKISAGEVFPEYYLIYPKRFDGEIADGVDEWVYFFKNSKVKTSFTAAGLNEAGAKLSLELMSKAERIEYDTYVKDKRIKANEYDTAKRDGKAEGIEIGKTEGKLEVAREMKAGGMAIEAISQFTKLSIKEIEEL
ncbi:MAG: Rpn family recombination-promoting nuclease/putative transposase [Spirochaetaceae bacterium]|jgi:predicted transposase/invertase (TIGR01784 family)|nr:Rpn family recombination-promoting nuclease/putative transposase [Spirochaetaceae bacterium]